MEGVSVIICCYNSAKRIKPTMEHLLSQEHVLANEWEIILVDNGSTDNTSSLSTEIYTSNSNINKPAFKVVTEKRPGLSFARKLGIAESKFDYVLFCDDDNWLSSEYIYNVKTIMQDDKTIGVLGGVGVPVFEGIEPPFFWINQFHSLAVGPQWNKEGDITNTRGVVYGAGMTLNKKSYSDLKENYDFEFQATDRIGNSLVSCGDHELCLAVKMIKYRIVWNSALTFKHYMPKNRTEISYYKKLFKGAGLSNPMLIGYYLNGQNYNNLKNSYGYLAMRYTKNLVFSFFKIVFSGYYFSSYENKYQYMEKLQSFFTNYGSLITTLKFKNFYKRNFIKSKLFQLISAKQTS